MRILFLTFFLLVSNQSFAEWKYLKGSIKDDDKLNEIKYEKYENLYINNKVEKSKLELTQKKLSFKITKNEKKGNNCEPFLINTEVYKDILLDKMYIGNECTPCIDRKGLCGRPTLISHFKTREAFDYFKTLDVPETKWHKELEKEGGKILRMDDYDSVYRSIHIAFGNREMLVIESRKVEYQNEVYPSYAVATAKYNTKYREILTKISNFTDIYDTNVIKQIEILFAKIYDALENPKSVTINNKEAEIIFSSHKDVSHVKFQTRD